MKIENDDLRICRNCKGRLNFKNEEKKTCPKCGKTVWFFNYQAAQTPPGSPTLDENYLNRSKHTSILTLTLLILVMTTLVGVFRSSIPIITFSLTATGFWIFGQMRHKQAAYLESKFEHYRDLESYSQLTYSRLIDVINRYNYLLQTGNERINDYYEKIYVAAEIEKRKAAELLQEVEAKRRKIDTVENRIYSMAERLIQDHLKWVAAKLKADPESYQRQKVNLVKTFDFVDSVGYKLPAKTRKDALDVLKRQYQVKVKEQALKDEQRRIKQQFREEEKLRKEQEQKIREAEKQEQDLQYRLEEILRDQSESHAEEIAELRRQLEEAHERSERAKSMAQQTKVGYVYVLSNIGAFGESVYKVGMTRRLEPSDRVKELSSASVPFPFDVHAMFHCKDAPALENALHRELTKFRVNRINFRKEFFKVDLNEIISVVEKHHGKIEYVATPEALEYNESLSVSVDQMVEIVSDLSDVGVSFAESEDDD